MEFHYYAILIKIVMILLKLMIVIKLLNQLLKL